MFILILIVIILDNDEWDIVILLGKVSTTLLKYIMDIIDKHMWTQTYCKFKT